MDGLIHISELSWSHVNHPSEVLEIGQTVKVKVLDIDRERQRISLGLKQTQSDPWQQVLESYNEGDVVEGRVTKVVTFGAFVEILPGVEGLVHISELAQHHVENPREVVSQGDAVNVLILEVDAERRRLSLSLKRVEEGQQPLPRADGGESVHPTPNLRALRGGLPGRRCRLEVDRRGLEAEARPTSSRGRRGAEAPPQRLSEAGCGGRGRDRGRRAEDRSMSRRRGRRGSVEAEPSRGRSMRRSRAAEPRGASRTSRRRDGRRRRGRARAGTTAEPESRPATTA